MVDISSSNTHSRATADPAQQDDNTIACNDLNRIEALLRWQLCISALLLFTMIIKR